MKPATFFAGTVLACTALAQDYYNITSKPFHLRTSSHDDKFDGTYLYACHEGAAIEGLCFGGKNVDDADEFHLNTSTYDTSFVKKLGKPGVLAWTLRGGNFEISEPMSLAYSPTSNLALPLFTPSDDGGTLVAFDRQNRLNIQNYVDDTVVPIDTSGPTKAYYRWYACDTYYGYAYTTLTWLVGEGTPQNPTCCEVSVTREFV